MKFAIVNLVVALNLLGVSCETSFADGGQVQSVQQQGHYQMTVFTSPVPLRAGFVDISVALQDSNTGDIVRDSQIEIRLCPPLQSVATIHAVATRESATNKLLKAAILELSSAGIWKVAVSAETKDMNAPIETKFSMEVAPPSPAWISVWPWFAWPAIPILLFWIHLRLVAGRLRDQATTTKPRHNLTEDDRSI